MQLQDNYANNTGQINAHSVEGETLKESFLKDALSVARAIARALKADGWDSKAHINRAGIAVSGEVYCDLIPPSGEYQFLLEIGSSALRFDEHVRKNDGVLMMLQRRTRDERRQIVGANIYLDPSKDSQKLAAEIYLIAKSS